MYDEIETKLHGSLKPIYGYAESLRDKAFSMHLVK
jgi:hypothetical protein